MSAGRRAAAVDRASVARSIASPQHPDDATAAVAPSLLSPADRYALQIIIAAGNLYRYGAAYGLDAAYDCAGRRPWLGLPHWRCLVSAAAVDRLEARGLVRTFGARFVAGCGGYVTLRAGAGLAAPEGWPIILREWNELPDTGAAHA